jgi:hypothetical protein
MRFSDKYVRDPRLIVTTSAAVAIVSIVPMFQIGAGAAGNNFGNLFRRALRTRVVL